VLRQEEITNEIVELAASAHTMTRGRRGAP
jgi:hypothetical protein